MTDAERELVALGAKRLYDYACEYRDHHYPWLDDMVKRAWMDDMLLVVKMRQLSGIWAPGFYADVQRRIRLVYTAVKRCPRCYKWKSLEGNFWKNNGHKRQGRAYQGYCKVCMSAAEKKRRCNASV